MAGVLAAAGVPAPAPPVGRKAIYLLPELELIGPKIKDGQDTDTPA